MYFLYVVLPLLLIAPLTVYAYILAKRIVSFAASAKSIKWIRRVSLLCAVLVMLPNIHAWKMYTILTYLICVFALLTDLVDFIIKKICRSKGSEPSLLWKKVFTFCLIPILCTAMTVAYGYYNINNVVEHDYTVYTTKSIQSSGYKIAMICDLHMGAAMDAEELQKVCDRVSKAKPDMVALCGDIVDENTSASDMRKAINALGTIKSKYGTFYIYGNHDDQHYAFHKTFPKEEFESAMRASGIKILTDSVYKVNNEFTIVGRLDKTYDEVYGRNRKTTAQLMKNVDKESFVLLLDHQPIHLSKDDQAGCDLLLAGHTHAGQIWPAGKLVSLVMRDALNYGYKEMDHLQVIVSAGISGWGFPVRTEEHSEYVMINVKPVTK